MAIATGSNGSTSVVNGTPGLLTFDISHGPEYRYLEELSCIVCPRVVAEPILTISVYKCNKQPSTVAELQSMSIPILVEAAIARQSVQQPYRFVLPLFLFPDPQYRFLGCMFTETNVLPTWWITAGVQLRR